MYDITEEGKLIFRPHKGQIRAWDATARFVAVIAGTQSGKTSFGPYWLYREMQRCGPGDYLVAAPTFNLLDLKLIPEFRRLFEQYLSLGRWQSSPVPKFHVTLEGAMKLWGYMPEFPTVVHFGHAANPDSLESMTIKAAWLDEPGQRMFKLGSFEAVLRRLSLSRGRVLLTTTPYFIQSWVKKLIVDKKDDPLTDIDVINFRSIDNPVFPREEYEERKRELPAWKFQMMYDGIFTRPAGLIYEDFNPELHIITRSALPERWDYYIGLDFGAVNTVALYYLEEPGTGRLYLYREYSAAGRTAKEHVYHMLLGEKKLPKKVYGGSKSEQQWRDEFKAAGLSVEQPKTTDVELGIDRVIAQHKENGILVFDTCTGYLEQKESYSRDVDEMGEPLDSIADKETFHFMDAERYVIGSIRRPRPSTYTQTAPSGYAFHDPSRTASQDNWYGR